MKCQNCEEDKPEEFFSLRKDSSNRRRPYCKDCAREEQKARYNFHRKNNPFLHRCTRAKSRASSLRLPFDLTPEYLESIWSGKCPVLGVDLNLVTDRLDEHAAELDRFVPSLGYTQGNVHWISRKANRIKNNTTVEILENLLRWMKNVSN